MIKRFFCNSSSNNILNKMKKNQVIIISGGTGIGKSDLSLKLAKQIKGEIIGADSVQIYKHLTVGSNKIIDTNGIPHHLIDIVDLDDNNFCLFDYYKLAKKSIEDIVSRGRIPIFVGGCGFYLDTILKGSRLDLSNDKERDEIKLLFNKIKQEDNWDHYHNLLKTYDPESAEIIQRNDFVRLSKSLYFNTVKGIKFSSQKNEYQDSIADEYDFRTFYLSADRAKMHKSLNKRSEAMFQMGLLEEVYDLLKRDKEIHYKNSKSSDSIGYREITNLLLKPVVRNLNDDSTTPTTSINLKESLDSIEKSEIISTILNFQTANRNYYRRQFSWFKKEKYFEWLNPIENIDVDKYIINSLDLSFEEWQNKRDLKKEDEIRNCSPKETKLISTYKPSDNIINSVLKKSNQLRNSLIQSNPELFD
ncbi:hypothetical protein RB653_010465 [Dictyostelium firmibasis]|uniref:tRNA dimethylallyltransferase n=1 Tax=Dictyostelium firmibasis TaxID=79012 RepID=A0AAN7YL28_9MYCE